MLIVALLVFFINVFVEAIGLQVQRLRELDVRIELGGALERRVVRDSVQVQDQQVRRRSDQLPRVKLHLVIAAFAVVVLDCAPLGLLLESRLDRVDVHDVEPDEFVLVDLVIRVFTARTHPVVDLLAAQQVLQEVLERGLCELGLDRFDEVEEELARVFLLEDVRRSELAIVVFLFVGVREQVHIEFGALLQL